MKKESSISLLLVLTLSAFMSCSIEVDQDPDIPTFTVSGTVYQIEILSTEDVLIGFFRSESLEGFDNNIFEEEDIVYDKGFDVVVTSGEFAPQVSTVPDSEGSFSLTLPDPQSSSDLQMIAWIDTDGDGAFDLGTETGYFPWRDYNSDPKLIDDISVSWDNSTNFDKPDMYYISFYDNSENIDLDFNSTDQGHVNWYFEID